MLAESCANIDSSAMIGCSLDAIEFRGQRNLRRQRRAGKLGSHGRSNGLACESCLADRKIRAARASPARQNFDFSLSHIVNIAFFSTKPYDRRFFDASGGHGHTLNYLEPRLTLATAPLARGSAAVCAFVNDQLNAETLRSLRDAGARLIALRSAGYNHVDLEVARQLGFTVVHVPHYSPHAVAEHTVALMLALNRHIHRAHNRVREGNFSIEGLLGFDLHGRTAGIIGAGKIGACVARILHGFGCRILLTDPNPRAEARDTAFTLAPLESLLAEADIITLHCPLTPATHHVINASSIARMKRGVMLVNTSRGALLDTRAAIDGLLAGQIGYLGIDVYEDEADLFYEDRSNRMIADNVFSRLLTLPNVLVTGHQAFFTAEALTTIAETTLKAISDFAAGRPCQFALVENGSVQQ
jgi:D-lactate dehydrogenase